MTSAILNLLSLYGIKGALSSTSLLQFVGMDLRPFFKEARPQLSMKSFHHFSSVRLNLVCSIVLVHGLGGHPKNTWSTSKRSTFADEDASPDTSLRGATIRTCPLFFKGAVSHNSYHAHAKDLLYDLKDARASCVSICAVPSSAVGFQF